MTAKSVLTTWAAGSHIGLVRNNNQDTVLVPGWISVGDFSTTVGVSPVHEGDPGMLFAVCDGMGGHAGGREASQSAAVALANVDIDADEKSFLEAIEQAHHEVLSFADTHPELEGMGTTVAALIVGAGTVTIGNVGDSPIYCLREGEVTELHEEHAISLNGRGSLLTQAVGQREGDLEPHALQIELDTPRRFMLCSDGISGFVPEDQFVECFSLGEPADAVAALIGEALEAGAADNASVIIIDVEPQDGDTHDAAEAAEELEPSSAVIAAAEDAIAKSTEPVTVAPSGR